MSQQSLGIKEYLSDVGDGCSSFFSVCLLSACCVQALFWGSVYNRAPVTGLEEAVCGFIMQPMKLKVHGSSFAGTPSTAQGGTPAIWLRDHTFWLNLQVTYLFFFFPSTRFSSPTKPRSTIVHCVVDTAQVVCSCVLHTQWLVGVSAGQWRGRQDGSTS